MGSKRNQLFPPIKMIFDNIKSNFKGFYEPRRAESFLKPWIYLKTWKIWRYKVSTQQQWYAISLSADVAVGSSSVLLLHASHISKNMTSCLIFIELILIFNYSSEHGSVWPYLSENTQLYTDCILSHMKVSQSPNFKLDFKTPLSLACKCTLRSKEDSDFE